jgi:hypothetical protein
MEQRDNGAKKWVVSPYLYTKVESIHAIHEGLHKLYIKPIIYYLKVSTIRVNYA